MLCRHMRPLLTPPHASPPPLPPHPQLSELHTTTLKVLDIHNHSAHCLALFSEQLEMNPKERWLYKDMLALVRICVLRKVFFDKNLMR